MGEKFNQFFKEMNGRMIGTIVGLIIGVIIIVPKVFFLLVCVVIGYFIGKYFDSKEKL